jgi:hypothetical protein
VRHQASNIFEVSDEIWEGSEVSPSDQSQLTLPSSTQQIASFDRDPLAGDAEFAGDHPQRFHKAADAFTRRHKPILVGSAVALAVAIASLLAHDPRTELSPRASEQSHVPGKSILRTARGAEHARNPVTGRPKPIRATGDPAAVEASADQSNATPSAPRREPGAIEAAGPAELGEEFSFER